MVQFIVRFLDCRGSICTANFMSMQSLKRLEFRKGSRLQRVRFEKVLLYN